MLRKKNLAFIILGILTALIYTIAVSFFSWYSNKTRLQDKLEEIDNRLLIVAHSLKHMLPTDFHDRAIDENSISLEEELKYRQIFSKFCDETEFKWLYTLAEKDGKYFFTAPTVTAEEAKEKESWYFYPYTDIPEEFIRAFQTSQTLFVTYGDQWGEFRSVAIPETSPNGKKYLACADIETTYLADLHRKIFIESILIALYFILSSIPVALFIRFYFQKSSNELKSINEELFRHKTQLEELILLRTKEIQEINHKLEKELEERKSIQTQLVLEKNKLEEALTHMKTLHGLLPICSSCKKIRDDKGYWSQLEEYIEQHSEAEFSHGICPDCKKRLYGNYIPS